MDGEKPWGWLRSCSSTKEAADVTDEQRMRRPLHAVSMDTTYLVFL